MPATEAQKKAMKKWRETHKIHYLAKQKEYQKKYLHNFDWKKIYNKIITNDINSVSILGYLGYKLRPFIKYDEHYILRIVKFIKKYYL